MKKGSKAVLDIGAGDQPYADADVAVDINAPPMKKRPPRSIWVILDKTAEPALDIPLKLPKTSQLKLYWVGDAKDLPDHWDGKFDVVKSRNALEALDRSNFQEPYAVLKRGGSIYIVANPPAGDDQERVNREHAEEIVGKLEKAGFVKVGVTLFGSDEMSFSATKPLTPRRRRVKPQKIRRKMGRIPTTMGSIRR